MRRLGLNLQLQSIICGRKSLFAFKPCSVFSSQMSPELHPPSILDPVLPSVQTDLNPARKGCCSTAEQFLHNESDGGVAEGAGLHPSRDL